MSHSLTPKQLAVLRTIRDFHRRQGYSPTMQEIGDLLQLSKVTVFEHVAALERKGLLHRGEKHHARSLRVSEKANFPDETPTRFPLAGRIAAGNPIEAIDNAQSLDLEQLFGGPGEKFVLEVSGDSMIDDQICPGDYVICQRCSTPRNGQTAVALLPSGEATLKRFYREKNRIRLQPANPAYSPIFVNPGEVTIQGVVVGVVRKY